LKFGPVAIETAVGKILGHHIAGKAGRRIFRKGRTLTEDDIPVLKTLGLSSVYVAELEPGDVGETDAARRIATALSEPQLTQSKPIAGRVNILSPGLGIMRVDAGQLTQVNRKQGVAVATVEANRVVNLDQVIASVKVIPYAISDKVIKEIETLGNSFFVELIQTRQVAIILSGSMAAKDRVFAAFEGPLRARLGRLGAEVLSIDYVPLADEAGEHSLAEKIRALSAIGTDLIIQAGETAIMDQDDILPRAVRRAGGEVAAVGVPVDPGYLLMLAYLEEIPIMGAPGCARSRKTNVIDWVLPRLLVGERLDREDLIKLGAGGLLEDTSQRPMPRG
jgi:hypothetical protein